MDHFYTQISAKEITCPFSIFSLSPHGIQAGTGAAAAAPLCRRFWWFRPLFRPPPSCPEFPLLLAIMSNPSNHSKQPPSPSNSSLKWGISQNPNLLYLEFYDCFLHGIYLNDQINSYCASFIEFGDVWSYGYLIKSLISWVIFWSSVLSKILGIVGLSKNPEIFTVESLYYLGFSGKLSWILVV